MKTETLFLLKINSFTQTFAGIGSDFLLALTICDKLEASILQNNPACGFPLKQAKCFKID